MNGLQVSSKFSIDKQSGELSVSGGFDYDMYTKQYIMVIIAKDAGNLSLSG